MGSKNSGRSIHTCNTKAEAKPGRRKAGHSLSGANNAGEEKLTIREQRARLKEEAEGKKAKAKQRKKNSLKRRLASAPRATLKEEVAEMLAALIVEAEDGSCPHAKIVLDKVDLGELPDVKEDAKERSLMEMLLAKLDGKG